MATVGACSGGHSSPAAQQQALPRPQPGDRGIAIVGAVRTGGQPCGVASARGSIWVSDAQRGLLLRINPSTHRVTSTTKLDATPCEITFAFGSLWVVTQSGRLDRVDPATAQVTRRIRVGAASYESVAAVGLMWVSNRNSGTLSQVDPRSNRVVHTQHLAAQPGGLVFANGALWVGDDTSGARELLRINPHTRRVVRVPTGPRPGYVTAAGGYIWVSDVDNGTLTQLNPRTLHQVRTVSVGIRPVNLAGTPGSRPEVWVPDDIGGQVIRIDASTGRVLGRLHSSGGPAVIGLAGRDIWVSLFESGVVLELRASS
jgi:DNA-binding beta-propeller fold protein YncE